MNRLLSLRPTNHSFIKSHIIFQRSLAKTTRLRKDTPAQEASRRGRPPSWRRLPPLQLPDGTILSAQDVDHLTMSESQTTYTNIVRAEPYFLTILPHPMYITWKSYVRNRIAHLKRISGLENTTYGSPKPPISLSDSSISDIHVLNQRTPKWNALIVSTVARKHRTPWFRFGRPLIGRLPLAVRTLLGDVWFAYDIPTTVEGISISKPWHKIRVPEVNPRFYTLSKFSHTLADASPPVVAAIKDAIQSPPLPKTISILDPSFPNEGRPAIDHPVLMSRTSSTKVSLLSKDRYGPLLSATADPAVTQLPLFLRVTRPWTRVDPIVVRELTSPIGSRILRFGGMQALLDAHTSLPDSLPAPPEGETAKARAWVRSTDTAGITEVDISALTASIQDTYAAINISPNQLRLPPSVLYKPRPPAAAVRVASNFCPDTPTPPLPPGAQLVDMPLHHNTLGNLPPPRKWLGADLVLSGPRIGSVFDLVPTFKITALSFSMFSFGRPLPLRRRLQPDEADEFREKMQQLHMPASAVLPHLPYFMPFSSDPAKVADAIASLVEVARVLRTLGLTQLQLPASVYLHEFNEPHAACRRIAEVINAVQAQVAGITIVLPLDASFKCAVPYRFEALREIISHVNDKTRVGVCLSTWMLVNAGYDITDGEKVHDVMMAFDRIVGRHYLLGLRLGDAYNSFAQKRSVLTGIAAGICHLDTFKYLLGSDWTDYMPIIDETDRALLTVRAVDSRGCLWRLTTQAAEEARVRRNEHVMDW